MLRRNNRKCLACISVFLVSLLMITLFLSETNVKASVFGSKNYYLYLEKNNLKDLKKKYKDYYIENYLSERSYECKASAKLDGDLMKYDEEMKMISDYLSKFELNCKYNVNYKDLKDSYFTLFLGAKYDNKDFADLDIKSAGNKEIITFPSLIDKAIGIDNSSTYEISTNLINAFLYDDKAFEEIFGLSRKAYDNMIERYLKDVIFGQIPDSKVVLNRTDKFEGINCNSITFNIDEEIIANICKALAKELEKDKDIRTICKSVNNLYMDILKLQELEIDLGSATLDEIDEGIQNICFLLYYAAENIEDVQIEYTAYFKDNGDILSRQFIEKESEVGITLSSFKDLLGNDMFNFNVKESEDSIFEIRNKMKLHNGLYNGECEVDISGKNLIKADYTYEKDAKVGGLDAFVGSIQGKVKLAQFKDDLETTDINDIYFSIKNMRKDNNTLQGQYAFTTSFDGKRMGITVFTEVKQSNIANISKPIISLDNAIMLDDITALSEFANEMGERIQEKIIGLLLSGSSEEEYLN
ncbi:hypothetical protein EHE19_018705 [Ruminiclostridium herbifermentans]|uniref:Uncharacterized protein n=1 Tax=Ruminiclostridium herbifermentans TaxID=2488810 RepID=A0A4U7JC98_9FIRM|nr:hypothetical protein [Ruminiclostridium herbifermentans]QNU66834.1 hypothetical protein EHE19_018705 [Ruminiclostridium herbifermentans]